MKITSKRVGKTTFYGLETQGGAFMGVYFLKPVFEGRSIIAYQLKRTKLNDTWDISFFRDWLSAHYSLFVEVAEWMFKPIGKRTASMQQETLSSPLCSTRPLLLEEESTTWRCSLLETSVARLTSVETMMLK